MNEMMEHEPSESFISRLSRGEARSDLSSSLTSEGKSRELCISSSALKPLSPQPRWSVNRDSLTLDKLKCDALRLYGRDEELDVLNKSLERLSSGVVERHLILISGESGTGKSVLAHSLKTPTKKLNGLFVSGKFDFNNNHEPYTGIVRACDEICDHVSCLQQSNLTLFQRVTQRVKEELGSELCLLIKFIPSLKGLVDFQGEHSSSLAVGPSSQESQNRFQFAFLRLMRIISDEFAPLIIVLDDLQWAEVSSLDLLNACLSDQMIQKLMIIGTYRSNEVDKTHVLHDAIAGLKVKSEKSLFDMTQMSVENLDVNAVNKIIGVLLSMENEAITRGLAQVCCKKTQGNPFFVLEFLQMARSNGLLNYNYGTFSWKWNNDEIESSTSATSNVVDLLKAKMAYLPNQVREMLKIAACLGSTFNELCLRIVFEKSSSVTSSGEGKEEDVLIHGLKYLEQDGYIIKRRSESPVLLQSYSWTHDKVQEAAIMLIPAEELPAFCRDAGDILLSRLDSSQRESTIFVLANLLNAGEALEENDGKRLILAHLNYDASLRALSFSAFHSVADYAENGIKLLPRNHWNDHYDLSLRLFSLAVQSAEFLGNTDLMEQYCSEVLSQNERPLRDKILVYHALVNSLLAKGQIEEATTLLFNVLAVCRCRFPKNPVSITAGLLQMSCKIKSIIKSFNCEELEESTTPMMFELMQLMDSLATCLYWKRDARLPLVIFRILDYTVKHGHTAHSSVAFAGAGLMLTGFVNDFVGGRWFAENALKLMEKSKSSATRSRTLMTVHSFVFPWTKPTTQSLKPLLQSYNEGLKSGDKDSASHSIDFWLALRFIMGNPLGNLVQDIQLYSTQMKDWRMKMQATSMSLLHQAVLHFVNHIEGNSMKLIGEVVSEEEYAFWSQDLALSPVLLLWQGALSTYIGDHVQHAISAIHYGHDYMQKRLPSSFSVPFDCFLKGVSCFAAARETGKMKFSKVGEKLRKKIKRWRELGNPNVIHYESLLDAESAALKNKRDDAIMHYEMAIIQAGRTGFLHDAALGCERLAEFYLNVMGCEKEAAYRFGQSLGYWREWGAGAKVEALEKKYGHLCHVRLSNATVLTETTTITLDESGAMTT